MPSLMNSSTTSWIKPETLQRTGSFKMRGAYVRISRLSDEERVDVDEAKALALMADYPTLIKRPVADTGSDLLVGFEPERYEKALKRELG